MNVATALRAVMAVRRTAATIISMANFLRTDIRLKNFDYKNGYIYFITICCKDKQPYFKNFQLAKFIESTIEFRIKNDNITIYCYCIMPDHLHFLISLDDTFEKKLSDWISSFKRYISKEARLKFNITNIWQKSFYEHVVRNDESLHQISDYILNNPVRKGIVKTWTEYPFSKIGFKFL